MKKAARDRGKPYTYWRVIKPVFSGFMEFLPARLNSPPADVNEQTTEIFFSSVLLPRYRSDLDTLMVFNPQQNKLRNTVSELVDRYGTPKIVEDRGCLRLQISSVGIAQALFSFDRAVDGNLIGVAVYWRESREYLAIVHLAIIEDYTISGCYGDRLLVLRLIQKIQEIGARLKGVEYLKILYDRSVRKIPVRHR